VRESDDIDVQVYRTVLDTLARAEGQEEPASGDAGELAVDDALTVPTDALLARRALEDALGRLAPEDRTVVVLHFVGGLSGLQLADLLDLPEHEVGDRLEAATAGLDLARVWEATR
jgi:DNA-directed RNA polymerase specialized sigma24 family protein